MFTISMHCSLSVLPAYRGYCFQIIIVRVMVIIFIELFLTGDYTSEVCLLVTNFQAIKRLTAMHSVHDTVQGWPENKNTTC